MAKKTNTTESIENKQVTQGQLDQEMKKAAKVLEDGKKKSVKIPEYLRKRLGNNVPVAVNGAVIHVPVGKEVEIPEAMAKVLDNKLKNLKL